MAREGTSSKKEQHLRLQHTSQVKNAQRMWLVKAKAACVGCKKLRYLDLNRACICLQPLAVTLLLPYLV